MLGPPWDFDLSAGNVSRREVAGVDGLHLDTGPWTKVMYADPAFREALGARWRELQAQGLVAGILLTLELETRRLDAPATRNHFRWGVFDQPMFRGQPTFGLYGDASEALRSWLERRAAWLDRAFAGAGT